MTSVKVHVLGALFAAALAGVDASRGAEPTTDATVVTIQGEMCGGCVKKMQGALEKLPGIARVDGDVAKKTITIVPAPQTTLSPKAIWEALESVDKKPSKLVGPAGEFVAKPNS